MIASILVGTLAGAGVVPAAASQGSKGAAAMAEAAQASPELPGALSRELGATPDQAAGAAGTLFGVVKSGGADVGTLLAGALK